MNISDITRGLHIAMLNIMQGQPPPQKPGPGAIDLTDVICFVGLIIFGIWLLKTSFGKNALNDSKPRRNNMPFYMPFVPLLIWFGLVSLAILIAGSLMGNLENWKSALLDNVVLCIGAVVVVAVIIYLARTYFARRLKGFGLNVKTIHKDFVAAFINLLAVWPLILLAIVLTTTFGKLIWGADYEIQQHEGLDMITTYSQLPLRILIIIVAAVVAPVLEEMLFRGLFQTAIRSFFGSFRQSHSAWLAIVISSGLFATIHSNMAHWPALFVLTLCMGYAYEKSGSLFRPIFIHALFNGLTVLATLSQ